jgi:hypothetical protein
MVPMVRNLRKGRAFRRLTADGTPVAKDPSMSRLPFCLTLAVAALLLACSNTPTTTWTLGTLTVHGTLPPTTRALDNARAVALGADGRTYAAYLDRTGQFTLDLPVGHAYLIAFANSRLDGSEAVIGHLVVHTSNGARNFLGARAPGQIELGVVSPALGATSATQGATGLKIACGCATGGGGDDEGSGTQGGSQGGGDYGCHENDGECNSVCDDGEDDDMQCEHDPGDDCESDDLDDDGGKGTCEQHVQQSCGGGSSSSSSSSSSSGGYSNYDSGAPSSGGCQVNAQCGSGQVCCGAACQY